MLKAFAVTLTEDYGQHVYLVIAETIEQAENLVIAENEFDIIKWRVDSEEIDITTAGAIYLGGHIE